VKLVAIKECLRTKSVLIKRSAVFLLSMIISGGAFAADSENLGQIADNITSNFSSLTQLITACSYIAGLGFAIGAIMKFKMHKDNPTQVPIGTPISLVFIAAALLFLPSILGVTGSTIFGSAGGTVAGPSGVVFT
jgi:intracellular multiplication protein IcmD